MPKLSYGPAAKQRVAYLFAVLLDYANDELVVAEGADEDRLERLRSHLSIHWEGDRTLIVRTKLRYVAQLSTLAPGDTELTTAHIKDGLKYLEQFLGILDDNRASRRGSDTWHFTLNLWSQRWDRDGNLHQFHQQWDDRRTYRSKKQALSSPVPSPQVASGQADERSDRNTVPGAVQPNLVQQSPVQQGATQNNSAQENAFWQQLCRRDLEQRQHTHLTTNPLTRQDGLTFTLEEMYVPLGLVKRSPRQENSGEPSDDASDIAPESDGGRKERAVVSPQELFTHLQAPQVNRVAVVGEPGAGKTTLLQQLAHWVLDQTQGLPVWVSLAELDRQSLEDYVVQTWLRQALGQYRVPTETVDAFVQQVVEGRVWLLLDAVDEMAQPSSMVLTRLAQQMTGWLAPAKIVLTCRQNIWDVGKNALASFQTYDCGSYDCGSYDCGSYNASLSSVGQSREPTDSGQSFVPQFIQQWFQHQPELGGALWAALNKSRLRRMKDVVANPLRLALLCRIWAMGQGRLPTTKALLYRQFVQAIYVWKQDYFPTSLAQQYQLNQALGDLAFQGINQSEPRFRFSQSFIQKVFQRHDLALLDLAIQLGWLKRVGREEASYQPFGHATVARTELGLPIGLPMNPEPYYSFYHGTFQDYFAAQVLSDGAFFLSCEGSHEWSRDVYSAADHSAADHSAAEPSQSIPIFEPQWQEAFLMWLGRDDISPSEKNAVLDALVTFRDDCGGFFAQRAYFLAARGLAEFPDYPQAGMIARQLVQWGYTSGDLPASIREGARRALRRTDQGNAIAALEAFLADSPNVFERWTAAYSLGKNYDPGNGKAIATLETIVAGLENPHLQMNVARGLGVIDPGNGKAIAVLTELLQTHRSSATVCKVALRLGQIDPGHEGAIATLVHQIGTLTNTPRRRAYDALAQIAPAHPIVQQEAVASASNHPIKKKRFPDRKVNKKHPAKQAPSPEKMLAIHLKKLDALVKDRLSLDLDQRALEQRALDQTDAHWVKCLRLAIRVERYMPGHERAIAVYLDCLRYGQHKPLLKPTFGQLQQIPENQIAIALPQVCQIYAASAAMADYGNVCDRSTHWPTENNGSADDEMSEDSGDALLKMRFCHRLLWEWGDRVGYAEFCRLWQNVCDGKAV